MTSPYSNISTRKTPQTEAIPGRTEMVENSAGGFVWGVDKWTRLERFLIMGTEGGTYYVDEKKLTMENFTALHECLKEDGCRTVTIIAAISHGGRAPKNDPALFALAACIGLGDEDTRKFAYKSFPNIVRTGTHLFQFMNYMKQFRGGFSGGLQRAIQDWYLEKDADKLAYQVVKYRQREGWTHRDVLRLVRPKADDPEKNVIFAAITGKSVRSVNDGIWRGVQRLEEFSRAQTAETVADTIKVLADAPWLPREALKTEHLSNPDVQMALLTNGMPMTAMIRNLGNMSKAGILDPMSEGQSIVCDQLNNQEHLQKSRVHPISLLIALKTYQSGHGFRGSSTWNVNANVVDALDAAFYKSFGNVTASNKRTMIALDVSGSMWAGGHSYYGYGATIQNTNLVAGEAAVAMAMITAATEPNKVIMAFSQGATILDISPRQRLDDVVKSVNRLPHQGTDCSLPMILAQQQNWDIEQFVIYTDNETWYGNIHPSQALVEYRRHSDTPAKLAVCGMTSNGFSIADPNDAGMLDVVGFDSSVPNLLTDFAMS